ncbi:MAG: hypothetical protein ACRDH2_12605 [Anaerolineales bacterium]
MEGVIGILVYGAGIPLFAGMCLYGMLGLIHLAKYMLEEHLDARASYSEPTPAAQPMPQASRLYTTGPITKPINFSTK